MYTKKKSEMFEKTKSAPWMTKVEIAGHRIAREQFEKLVAVVTKYAKSPLQVEIVKACFPDVDRWQVWANAVSDKRIAELRYVLRRVDKAVQSREFFPLFRNIQRKTGYCKSSLLNVLEYLFYIVDPDTYRKYYARQIGFYGLSERDAYARLDRYWHELTDDFKAIGETL